jgi:hypothetical protein
MTHPCSFAYTKVPPALVNHRLIVTLLYPVRTEIGHHTTVTCLMKRRYSGLNSAMAFGFGLGSGIGPLTLFAIAQTGVFLMSGGVLDRRSTCYRLFAGRTRSYLLKTVQIQLTLDKDKYRKIRYNA